MFFYAENSEDLIDSDPNDAFGLLTDINGGDDFDRDGMSNLDEYIAGTYAFDGRDRLQLRIVETKNGISRMRFLAITGRGYRLEASADLENYAPAEFSTSEDASEPVRSYRAASVGYMDIYVPVDAENPTKLYRLNVQ